MRLVESLVYSKLILRIFLVAFGVFVFGYVLYNQLKPVPPLQVVFNPDYRCGPLPAVKIESPYTGINYKEAQITINTKEEALRFMPPIAYVYRVRYKGETFTLRERLFSIARTLRFETNNYTKPKPYLFRWEDARRVLVADSRTGSFLFTFKPEVLATLRVGTFVFMEDAATVARAAVSDLRLLAGFSQYSIGKPTPMVYDAQKGTFVVVDSAREASVIRINFFSEKSLLLYDLRYFLPEYRKKLGNVRINFVGFYTNRGALDPKYTRNYVAKTVGDKPVEGNPVIYVHTRGGDRFNNAIVRISYYNWDIEDTPCGTYPLLDVNTVISKITQKEAAITYLAPFGQDDTRLPPQVNLKQINILEVSLVYYMSSNWSEFLQPIYMVKGTAYDEVGRRYDIIFYVDAILRE